MCGKGANCQQPKSLKGKPEKCSQKQVRQCHGTVKNHPCVKKPTRK